MDISLAGRVAVITGGSKGIGFAIAERFARSGANVAIIARGKDALGEAATAIEAVSSGSVFVSAADVSLGNDVAAAYQDIMQRFSRIDIIVNNAGTSRAGAFEELTDELMQEDLDQKLTNAGNILSFMRCNPKAGISHVFQQQDVLGVGQSVARSLQSPKDLESAKSLKSDSS